MNNTKSGTSKASKSRKRPPVDDEEDEFGLQTPWPENPDGYVIPQREIEQFIGGQIIYEAHLTAERFVVVAEAALAIGRGEDVDLNRRLIRYVASEDSNQDYRQVMKAMISAIEAGDKGIHAAYSTARYLLEFGFEYTACCNRERLYEKGLTRMRRAAKRRK
jgi:hypothetical protein